jgi:hypothetical protein
MVNHYQQEYAAGERNSHTHNIYCRVHFVFLHIPPKRFEIILNHVLGLSYQFLAISDQL